MNTNYCPMRKYFSYIVLYYLLFIIHSLQAQTPSEESSKKKIADRYFDGLNYTRAQEMYRELSEKNPANDEYSFKYGTCLMFTDTNKAACMKYLLNAVKQPNPSALSYFYMAKAFHRNYKFEDAIIYFEKFKLIADIKEVEKYDIDLYIQYCKNARMLMEHPVTTDILSQKIVHRDFFTSAYELFLPEEKVYSLSETFKTKVDKKNRANLLMCFYNNNNNAIFSSYGSSGKNGKDLFRKIKYSNEVWSKSSPLGKEINSPYDEDYPFITSDGSVLYFCSNGTGSLGGYDIFKCEWDEQQQRWSKPQNMGYPINSAFDDLLFVPIAGEQIAYLASDRTTPLGKMEVLKIKYPKEIITSVLIKGMFEVADHPEIKKAQLTVVNLITNELTGIYNTTKKGEYILLLVPGARYQFMLKAKGYQEHSVEIRVPEQERKYLLKQYIRLEKNNEYETAIFYNFSSEKSAAAFSTSVAKGSLGAATDVVKSEREKSNNISAADKKEKPAQYKSEKEREGSKFDKEANNAFKIGDYTNAMQLYFRLLVENNLHPKYNYRAGICMMYNNKDKSLAIPYLEKASVSLEVPGDVFFYLGRCHHLSGNYQQAISYYEKYKAIVSLTEISKQQIDLLITQSKNGLATQHIPPKYEIVNKKLVFSESIYLSFNTYEFSGKFLVAPDEFRTEIDKINNFKPILFLTKDNKTLYYSSYGADGKTGKDIYKREKLPSGEWGEPQYMQGINSAQDEDYPFMATEGVLYFSSTGYNSIGGYDVFRAEWIYTSQAWNVAGSMDLPVNSPADDIFFLLCKDGESIYFSSDRNSTLGSMEIFNAHISH